MSMFSDYSLEEAREHFSKFLASEEFKEMSRKYFSSLMSEKNFNVSFSKETSTVQLNSVNFLVGDKVTNNLPKQILSLDETFLAA